MAKTAKYQIPPFPTKPEAFITTYADAGKFQSILDKFPKNTVIWTKNELLEWVQKVYKAAHKGTEHPSQDLEEIIKKALDDHKVAGGKALDGAIFPPENKSIIEKLQDNTEAFIDFLNQGKFREYAIKNIKIEGKSIRPDEYDTHVDEVRKDYPVGHAKWLVYDYVCVKTGTKDCVQYDYKDYGQKIAELGLQKCICCGELNEKIAFVCYKCRTPLKCPKCQSGTNGTENCPKCGEEPFKAIVALKEAIVSLENDDIPNAEKFIRQVNYYWRECDGADEVRKRIDDEKIIFEKTKKEINVLEEKIRTALGQRNLYDAQRLILKLREIPQAKGYLVEEEKNVNKNLADVQAKLARLPKLSDTDDTKIDICEEILAIAADCKEARIGGSDLPTIAT